MGGKYLFIGGISLHLSIRIDVILRFSGTDANNSGVTSDVLKNPTLACSIQKHGSRKTSS